MSFPKLGMWQADPTVSTVADIARYDWICMVNQRSSYIASIRAANPTIDILTDGNAQELTFKYNAGNYDHAFNVELRSAAADWIMTCAGSTISDSMDSTSTSVSVTVELGHGTRFIVGRPVIISGTTASPFGDANAEIARVTAIAGDVLTVTRGEAWPKYTHASGTRIAMAVSNWHDATVGYYSFNTDLSTACPEVGGQTWTEWRAAQLSTRYGAADWDGLLVDRYDCNPQWWTGATNPSLDQNRDNVADTVSASTPWMVGSLNWNTGLIAFGDALKAACNAVRAGVIIVTNGCIRHDALNGSVHESFPTTTQTLTTWNYQINEWGNYNYAYLDSLGTSTAPVYELIETKGAQTNYQLMRFGLCSALLGDGYFAYVLTSGHGDDGLWWYDEYDNAGSDRGYLGQPMGVGASLPTSNTPTSAIIDSYPEANYATYSSLNGTLNRIGQCFTGAGVALDKVQFYLRKASSGTFVNSVTCKIYALNGATTYGTDGFPTGDSLATSSAVAASSLTTAFALVDFEFDGTFTPVDGTKYCAVLDYASDGTANVLVGIDNTSPTHDGNSVTYTTGWAGSNTQDVIFYAWGVSDGDPSVRWANITNVYCREFDHGIVLVNPNESGSATVTLGATYRKINGSQSPVNDDSLVSSVTLQARDGIILLRPTIDVEDGEGDVSRGTFGNPVFSTPARVGDEGWCDIIPPSGYEWLPSSLTIPPIPSVQMSLNGTNWGTVNTSLTVPQQVEYPNGVRVFFKIASTATPAPKLAIPVGGLTVAVGNAAAGYHGALAQVTGLVTANQVAAGYVAAAANITGSAFPQGSKQAEGFVTALTNVVGGVLEIEEVAGYFSAVATVAGAAIQLLPVDGYLSAVTTVIGEVDIASSTVTYTETRYLRSDTDSGGGGYRKLLTTAGTANTIVSMPIDDEDHGFDPEGSISDLHRVRVLKRTSGGTETVIATGAETISLNTSGVHEDSLTVAVPATSLSPTDRIIVELQPGLTDGSITGWDTNTVARFVTGELGASGLPAHTMTLVLQFGASTGSFGIGSDSGNYDSRVTNFKYEASA